MRKFAVVAMTAIVLIATAGCGDDDTTSSSDTTAPAAGDGMDMDDGGHESFAFGEPAEVADADRTIDVDMSDDFSFEPDSIAVTVGETVAFRVTNSGQIVHEFVIGDQALQDEHEQAMQETEGDMMMADEPNAVSIEPGGTKTLALRFTEAGELEYACHQPGHYEAGMRAPLIVS